MSPTLLLFLFREPAPAEIYTLSLHDALPISSPPELGRRLGVGWQAGQYGAAFRAGPPRWRFALPGANRQRGGRSEEHTSELQSQSNLVCRLLLEKKKKERQPGEGTRETRVED